MYVYYISRLNNNNNNNTHRIKLYCIMYKSGLGAAAKGKHALYIVYEYNKKKKKSIFK